MKETQEKPSVPPTETPLSGSGEIFDGEKLKTNGDPTPKFKIGDYIKRVNRKRSKISFQFPFFIGETVVVEGMYLDSGYGEVGKEWVYECINKHGIVWRLCECEAQLSEISEYNYDIREYTPEFIKDNLYLCGRLKEKNGKDFFDHNYQRLFEHYHSVFYNRRMERRDEELRYILNEKETFFTKLKNLLT